MYEIEITQQKANYEIQFPINSVLKYEIEKRFDIKKTLKRLESTHQTYNLNNEIKITSYKANQNK